MKKMLERRFQCRECLALSIRKSNAADEILHRHNVETTSRGSGDDARSSGERGAKLLEL